MNIWFDEVLAPYIAITPAHVTHIIVLDLYCCQMMPTDRSRIKDLGAMSSIFMEDVPPSSSPLMLSSISHSRTSFGTFEQFFGHNQTCGWKSTKPGKNSGCNVDKALIGHDDGGS